MEQVHMVACRSRFTVASVVILGFARTTAFGEDLIPKDKIALGQIAALGRSAQARRR
jgi:hypothetical protein